MSSSSCLDEENPADLLSKVLLTEDNGGDVEDDENENEYLRRSIIKLPIDELHPHVSFRISRS